MKFLLPLILTAALSLSGCATIAVNDRIEGFNIAEEPNPYYYGLLPFAMVFDVATFPLQFIGLTVLLSKFQS